MEILTWQARTTKHLTLKQLEQLSGISKTSLNDIENGKISPTLYQLEQIAKALDVKITELFSSEYK
ncbi:MAG: helix-turn-helix transcriptional regulator [Hespellia sp.]|nr:helix-turn-helix transcriptional regulator [Hespellia sp.]